MQPCPQCGRRWKQLTPGHVSPEQSSLVERLRARVKIETACGNRTENPNNHVRLMDEAADALERLSQPSDGVTEEMIEKLVREAYEEGVGDGMGLDPLWGAIPQWIDSVARVDLLRAMRAAATSDRSE